MTRRVLIGLLALGTLAACDKTGAYGDANSIIVGTPEELWNEIRDSVYAVLEPRIFTVRDERTFRLTHQDPRGEDWRNLREFKQELLIGSRSDPWIAEALQETGRESFSPPEIIQAADVWARGQNVTILLLPEGGGAQDVYRLLEPLHELLDEQYRSFARARMFVTGRDTALADTLRNEAGFALTLPNVYYWDRQDSVYIFRNDNPDPSELIRQIAVTWRTPPVEELEADTLLEWRQSLVDRYYSQPQALDTAEVFVSRGGEEEREVVQVQAVWSNPPGADWPAGGPFITRAVTCPSDDRTYLLDAWLYAPGKEKYEYMLQLETILGSFRCGLDG